MKIGDRVKCPRLGDGEFKVLDERGKGSSAELQLRSVDTPWGAKEWIYKAHCTPVNSVREKWLAKNKKVRS